MQAGRSYRDPDVPVLVVTSRADDTADYLCGRMTEHAVEFIRLDTELISSACSLSASPTKVELSIRGVPLRPVDAATVWYRRPLPPRHTGGRDEYERAFSAAEWTAALEGFLAYVPMSRWMNHPARIVAASSKLEQLSMATRHGLVVPRWLCTTSPQHALDFYCEQDGCIVAKPLYCGYVERKGPDSDSVIYTSRVRREDLETTGPTLGAPTLFQREIRGGLDIRVTIVDDELIAVGLARNDGAVDVRRDNMAGVRYSIERLPSTVEGALHDLTRSYGLRFAAIDMIVQRGEWYFLEINPNGQWAWMDLLADTQIHRAFLKAFANDS